jgi:hypothetical protein
VAYAKDFTAVDDGMADADGVSRGGRWLEELKDVSHD